MTTVLDFKSVLDQPAWRGGAAPLLSGAGAGVSFAFDLSNTDADRMKTIFLLRAASALDKLDPVTNDFVPLTSPGLAGTFGAGSAAIFAASHGPRSKILSGATTSLIPLDGLFNNVPYSTATWARATSTATVTTAAAHGYAIGQQVVVAVSSDVAAIPLGVVTIASVPSGTTYTFGCPNSGATSGTLTIGLVAAANMMANRGDNLGFTIRVIDNGSGGSGKVETRKIIGNTGGVQPIVELDSPLSFTPVVGSSYEIRSGRVYMLNPGTAAAGQWKYYDPATNTVSGNLGVTNLAVATDSALFHMCEDYVPHNRVPGSGFVSGGATANGKNCIQATAAGATSITGSGMPAGLLADEYRNFQIRIVEDTVNVTAAGQRRRITSHTSGATGVFTVPTWTVTPSSSAKFVVEYDDDKILCFTGSAFVYTHNIAANTWDTTTFAAPAAASGTGVVVAGNFGIVPDGQKASRHSHIYRVRGANSQAIDILDIAAAATGVWSPDIWYNGKAQTFTTGTSGVLDPVSMEGRFLHICVNGTQRFVRFDMKSRTLEAGTFLPFPPGTAQAGGKCAMSYLIDGETKLGFLLNVPSNTVNLFYLAISR
jgi:hypothetical protein